MPKNQSLGLELHKLSISPASSHTDFVPSYVGAGGGRWWGFFQSPLSLNIAWVHPATGDPKYCKKKGNFY